MNNFWIGLLIGAFEAAFLLFVVAPCYWFVCAKLENRRARKCAQRT